MSFIILFVLGCSEEEKCYSCDPEIDTWVKKNINEIVNFDRAKIATFSHSKQKAILGALSPDRKKVLWQEKVDYLLDLDLTKEEKVYIDWYADAFKKFNYNMPIDKKLEKEMYDKLISGIKTFNWSNEFVYKAFFVLGDIQENLLKPSESSMAFAGGGSSCNCMYDLGCSGWNNSCGNVTCGDNSATDCGFFGGSDCTGICDADYEEEN